MLYEVITAMFPKVAPKFFKERANGPVVFEAPSAAAASSGGKGGSYVVNVNGTDYSVTSGPSGETMSVNRNNFV